MAGVLKEERRSLVKKRFLKRRDLLIADSAIEDKLIKNWRRLGVLL